MNVETFNVHPGLRNIFEPLINNEEHADVILVLKGKRYYGHKIILASRSKFFKELFIRGPRAQRKEKKKSRHLKRMSKREKKEKDPIEEKPEDTKKESEETSTQAEPKVGSPLKSDEIVKDEFEDEEEDEGLDSVPSTPSLDQPTDTPSPKSPRKDKKKAKGKIEEVILDMEALTEESLEALLRIIYIGDRSLFEKYKTEMERYIGPWTINLVKLYGTKSQLGNDMRYAFNKKYFHDCTFKIGTEVIYAHKVILTSRCKYFKVMLSGQWKEATSSVSGVTEIEINQNISAASFLLFLEFLYTDIPKIPSLEACFDLIAFANFYGVESLQWLCENYLQSSITVSSLCGIWNVANQFNVNHLVERCLAFFVENFDLVVYNPNFLRLHKKNLELALSRLYLPYNKRDKFEEVLINWSRENRETVQIPPRLIKV